MDGRRQQTPSAILSVSKTRDVEGHADVTLRVTDKDVTFQVPVDSLSIYAQSAKLKPQIGMQTMYTYVGQWSALF